MMSEDHLSHDQKWQKYLQSVSDKSTSDNQGPSQKDPHWEAQVLAFFRRNKYSDSLVNALKYYYNGGQTSLNLKDYAIIFYTISASAFGVWKLAHGSLLPDENDLVGKLEEYLSSTNPKNIKELCHQLFFKYLDCYLQTCKVSFELGQTEGMYTSQPSLLCAQCLQLLINGKESEKPFVKEKSVYWIKRFLEINHPDWQAFPLTTLLSQIQENRIDFHNPNHIQHTVLLSEVYLSCTEHIKMREREGRVAILNILSDMAYFRGDREESRHLNEKALQENREDEFAKNRKQLLEEQEVIEKKIGRFEHDANTTIGNLRNLMGDLLNFENGLPESAQAILYKMEGCIDRLFAMNRLMQNIAPVLTLSPLSPLLLELKTVFSQKLDLIWTSDCHQELYTHTDFLRFVLENLLKNAWEAFERNQRIGRCRVNLQGVSNELTISDNSGGLENKYRTGTANLFDAYESSKNEIRVSSGLGLYNARKMMELLKGELQLASIHPADGTSFVLRFPSKKIPTAFQ